MRKTIKILIISTLCVIFITSSAFAGSKRRHRLEGVAIGIGAAILGKAIIDSAAGHYADRVPCRGTVVYREPPPRRYAGGHWEIKQVWVPPVYKRIWKPGHYNRRGYWVQGRWVERIQRYGFWKEEEIWVAHEVRHRRYR